MRSKRRTRWPTCLGRRIAGEWVSDFTHPTNPNADLLARGYCSDRVPHTQLIDCRAMMELVEVTKLYQQGRRTVQAVRGVSLRIGPGEFVSIMGPSGSGKSTLMHLLGALDTPTTGKALFRGRDLNSMSDRERALLSARLHRLRLPVLQPAAHADRRRERRAAAVARRRIARQSRREGDGRRWSASACATGPTTFPMRCPAARCSASPSRGR